ncbi:VG15 protein [Nesterenkonia marinintestina]|uniref:VG15 protein n=1 Tax=Nesterenkonia marinintestina TaxID=2979865 RepID=UPI0021BEBFBB|nr:hypothetical protein [Nesterenkonia sp. GX14115]
MKLYEDIVDRLGAQASASLLGLNSLMEAGTITREEFIDTAATVVDVARQRGTAAGEAYFRAYAEQATGRPYTLAATLPESQAERLSTALATILAASQDTHMQLDRLATAEPMEAASDGFQQAMQREKTVTGWTRGLDTGACQLCTWWWREGRVFQPTHRMPRHTGCRCHPVPQINVRSRNYQTEAQAQRLAR